MTDVGQLAASTDWTVDPLALSVVAAVLAVVHARRRRAPRGGWRGRDTWLLGAGVVAVLALVSPIAALNATLVSAHMVQHVLLLFVVAPMVAAGDPGPTVLHLLPPRARRTVVAGWHGMPHVVRGPGGALALAAVASAAALWAWHTPALYRAAVRSPALHVVEHLTLLVPAVVFWGAVVRRRSRHRHLLVVTVLASVGLVLAGGVLGAVLTFAPQPLYVDLLAPSPLLSPLEDQQLAGSLLWVVGGPAYALAAVTAVLRALRATDDLAPDRAELRS